MYRLIMAIRSDALPTDPAALTDMVRTHTTKAA